MRISAVPIINFFNVNAFSAGNQWTIRSGEANSLYFQLVDLDNNSLRYIAGIGTSNQPIQVSAIFPSIDSSKVINVVAIPDPNDGSIFRVSLSSVQVPSGGNVQFSVAEGSSLRKFSVINMLAVENPGNNGSC